MKTEATILRVSCTGARSGEGPVTWGQYAIWHALQKLVPGDYAYNVPVDGPVSPPLPLETIREALGGLLYVHDALRTRVVQGPDGELRQYVDAEGDAALHVRPGTAETAAELGVALRQELWGRSFDYAGEWQARFGVVVEDGLVHHVAAVFSHTAADAWGLPRLMEDLIALSTGASPEQVREAAAADLQPLEQAAEQRSARGQRLDAAARRHWRTAAAGARAPKDPVTLTPGPDDPPYRRAHLISPALPQALARLCPAVRATPPTVLLAATALTMAEWAGTGRCGLQLMVNNRFHSGLARATGPLAMEGYLAIDTEGADFTELLGRTKRASLATYRSAYYDKSALETELAPYADDPGVVFERSCWYNDQRVAAPPAPDPAWDPAAAPAATLDWQPATDHGGRVGYVLHMADQPGGLEIAMTADSRLFTPAEVERLLRGIERTVLEQAAAVPVD
ncbi:condensation domain-containing protein [Kitasatospora sp. NPDC096147]|uniref:condensation domain-containing protein n=1 Tax=Kitasatospora sp. NPDC096147 TaxID=3364093 RepID=UPI00380E2496